jgi:hypothetical protein
VSETERESGTTMWCVLHTLDLNVSNSTVITPVLLMKGYYNRRYGQSGGKDTALPTGNNIALKDFVTCLYNILIEFGIPKKLVRLIKVCLTETYNRVRVGKNLNLKKKRCFQLGMV